MWLHWEGRGIRSRKRVAGQSMPVAKVGIRLFRAEKWLLMLAIAS